MPRPLKILVLLASVRRGRFSSRVATFVMSRLSDKTGLNAELVDFAALRIPIMEERLGRRDDPPEGVVELAAKIVSADGLLIVTPEYNHGYPGVLKNALDYYHAQFKRKPVAIITVSSGNFGGVNCYAQLLLVLNYMGALLVPTTMPVPRVQEAFDAQGHPIDQAAYELRLDAVIDELSWLARAVRATSLDENDLVEEASDESFPASDPPARTAVVGARS